MSAQQFLPGATIGIVGGGQLGRMFALFARRLGYRVHTLDPAEDCQQRAFRQELLEEPFPRDTDGETESDLPAPLHRASQEQIGHICAGNEQDDDGHAHDPRGDFRIGARVGTARCLVRRDHAFRLR